MELQLSVNLNKFDKMNIFLLEVSILSIFVQTPFVFEAKVKLYLNISHVLLTHSLGTLVLSI